MSKNQISVVIDPILKEENHYYGFLRSIPLIKTYHNIQNFTFVRFLNHQFPPFIFNYILLHKDYDFTQLQGKLCQIVNQQQELESEHDITYWLYQNFINSRTKLEKLVFVFDSVKFKLKFENNLEDKAFIEDKGLIHVSNYDNLLKRQFKKEGRYKIPISIEIKSGNYFIQRLALDYQLKMEKNIKFLADLFDFDKLYGQSPAWDMLVYFAKNTDASNYVDIISSYLRSYIESDITKISRNFFDALKSKNFNYKKIVNWRLSMFQK